MASMGLMGGSALVGRSRRVRRTRLLADGLAAAVVLTGVTVGMVNVAGASGTSNGKAKTIKVSTTTIPKVGTVLTTASGLTLYRFTQDPTGKSACTGVCAKAWPPLTAAKGAHVQGPKGVKGLSVINVGHGRFQVAFHNVALYRFVGDKKKGEVKGQGLENVWFAVMKSGIPAGNAAAPATSTTAPGSSSTPAPAVTPTTPVTAPPPTPVTMQPAPAPTHVTSPPVTAPPATTTTAPPVGGGAAF
jgi:predicted lipoprotein with Yx(FWY)xxD motif